MDIGWYKDNIALQAELRREYPDVAELIAELEQQITRYREVIAEQAHISAEHDVRMYAAEAQLSDARAEVERYKAGVEVEGYVAGVPTDISNDLYFASGWSKYLAHLSNKKARVLIMKLEV